MTYSADNIRNRDSIPLLCDICREEIYDYELFHIIDGKSVCAGCFLDFAFDYFSECLTTPSELRRNTYEND